MNKLDVCPKTAAIFDLDGTLFTGHFWHGIVEHHRKHRVKTVQTSTYLVTHYPLWIGNKLKLISEEGFKTKWGEDLAVLLKGFSEDEMINVFKWIDEFYFAGRLRLDMMELLQSHLKQGHTIFLLSGAFQGFLEIIKQNIGIEHVVGTRLDMVNGRCSGRVEKPFCFGKYKVVLLRQYINRMNLKIDLEASFAYADSLTDVPVLEMVGNPVASYPAKGLLQLAKRRDWRVVP